ncbi:MAG: UDP-N-acetylmuramoyl-L-alanine--D-glutamate ligase [Ornithinimicrobium sp.]
MSTGRPVQGLTHRDADWAGLGVLVTGLGVSGVAAARALVTRGARVQVVDGGGSSRVQAERAEMVRMWGVEVRLGAEHIRGWPDGETGIDLVVSSPGWRPDHAVLAEARRRGVPVWGEVELAWRMRPRSGAAPWLCVTGTNGKTTTVLLLESMLRAAGLRALAAGNVGTAVLDAVLAPEPYDMLAVELSSFQLHSIHTVSPLASCVLNLADDHLDWHGSAAAYAQDKARIYQRTQLACVYNVQDEATERMVAEAEVMPGCRAIGFTVGVPAPSMVGVVEEVLADRAFVEQRSTSAAELATLEDIAPGGDPAVHQVANTLAAAALARAAGVPPAAVREGLRRFSPQEHRITEVGSLGGIRFVNDSKATNAHAAAASLAAYPDVVWIAGGQLKGADVDSLVSRVSPRLRGVVLLGVDRAELARALARHAPQVRVVEVATPETESMTLDTRRAAMQAVMDEAVGHAIDLAGPSDVVLLAPAAASLDMFDSYEARGRAFTDAVRSLGARS